MDRILDQTTTLTFSANASSELQAISIPKRDNFHVKEIDTANQDADLTIEDVLIDGQSLGLSTFPIDLESIYGKNIPAYNKIEIKASESAGSTADVDVILNGFKRLT